MNQVFLIARRELVAAIRSPLACVIVAAALLLDGILFYTMALTERLLSAEALAIFLYNSSGIVMTASLFLAMRLIAEERQTSTFILLNTAPVRGWQIIAGKFLSAWAILTVMVVLTVYMPALLFVNGKVSVGHILVGYLGLLLIGAATVSIGLFASALTRSQLVAIIVGAAILAVMILLWMLAKATEPPINTYLSWLAFHHANFRPFQLGRLELQSVAYYLAVTYFFLLGATKILESRRWR